MDWHKRREAGALLRMGGLASLALACLAANILFGGRSGAAEPTILAYVLASIAFIGASIGTALLLVGPRLFDQVDVSERWVRRQPAPDADR